MKQTTKNRIVLYGLILITVLIIFLMQSFNVKEQKLTLTDYLDTVCDFTVYSRSKKPLDSCVDYLKKMDAELSASDESSSLYQLNIGKSVNLSEDALDLIEFGKNFGSENPDLFSIYLNPLVTAWDIKNNTGYIPDVTKALEDVTAEKSINLGGVAKGFLTDRIIEQLQADGVTSALINLGGNAYAIGKKPTGENWKIGIQDPKNESELIGIVTAENLAVITSGDYQRYFELDGVRYHHIFDPTTGYPAQSGLRSVTVISENATLADALSTAIFVAGVEKGIELLNKYNVRGILVTDDTVYFSKSLENIFKQLNFSYKYKFIY
ncbi:MAG: FAD:protein FMN transferase [Clostridia bacterium]|nr:FAD:protein FMN transferase [Clostridia bacterium]